MNVNTHQLLFIVVILSIIVVALAFSLFLRKYIRAWQTERHTKIMRGWIEDNTGQSAPLKGPISMLPYLRIRQNFVLTPEAKESIEDSIRGKRRKKHLIRGLRSPLRYRRMECASLLWRLDVNEAGPLLEQRLPREKDSAVKLQIVNALSEIEQETSIPVLVESLIGSHRFYRDKVNMLIADFGPAFEAYLPELMKSDAIEIKELIIDYASYHVSEQLTEYLLNLIDNREEAIERLHERFGGGLSRTANAPPVAYNYPWHYKQMVYRACSAVARFYPEYLSDEKYLLSVDSEIRNIAIRSLANYSFAGRRRILAEAVVDPATQASAEYVIASVLQNQPGMVKDIAEIFHQSKSPAIKRSLARVLSSRLTYFIMRLNGSEEALAEEVIYWSLLLGLGSPAVSFMNQNHDTELEDKLVNIVRRVKEESEDQANNLAEDLNERLRARCGLVLSTPEEQTAERERNKVQISGLLGVLVISLLIFPVIFVLRYWGMRSEMPIHLQVRTYVIDFNYYLVFYSLSLSGINLSLLFLSAISANKQLRLWRAKGPSMLFKKRMLPSISVIAPAYNEEKTIINSTNSLLNLEYPDYELIIVNDGSKDATLQTLIRHFNLARVNYHVREKLETRAIRGIYMNKNQPKLIVVDKMNGGKADALNTGINVSRKEYFCCIDADSLLDQDALLKLASLTLDENIETPALGGNVFPINGSAVDQGMIRKRKISDNPLVRLQTIEYLRAFMTGRTGWEQINSLMIISGAFGLFRKERVVNIGGYLTQSGIYQRNTVGEDMELVVRINRFMREKRQRYRVRYAFNANCWTEVPEDVVSLKNQRFRWQRGLLDTLFIHKKMIFNPSYGRIGFLAMPYFFIFEMLGPLIEVQGYLMVVLAFFLGLLNAEMVLLLLIASVLLGMVISVASLLLVDLNIEDLSVKAIIVLISYAFLENLGPRQLLSIARVGAYIEAVKNPDGWNKGERIGFTDEQAIEEKA